MSEEVETLADWAEASVVSERSRSVGLSQLTKTIEDSGVTDSTKTLENIIGEIDRRTLHAGVGYPFIRRDNALILPDSASRSSPYVFQLLISIQVEYPE